jgi:hypothetical protein
VTEVISSKYIVITVACLHNPHGNHKENTYGRYTKENEEGIKACHYIEIKHKGSQHQREKASKKLQDRRKNGEQNGNSKSFPINNYYK